MQTIYKNLLCNRHNFTQCAKSITKRHSSKNTQSSNVISEATHSHKKLFISTGVFVSVVFGYAYHRKLQQRISCEDRFIDADIHNHHESYHVEEKNEKLKNVIEQAESIAEKVKDEVGAPGLVIAVSVDGKTVWADGLGYADVENRLKCRKDTVMRIASISKSIAMTIVAKLWESGKLDIDKPVEEYVPSWPEKVVDGQKAIITTRQLVSHLGGVRHYEKNCNKTEDLEKNTEKGKDKKNDGKKKESEASSEFEQKEYHLKDYFKSIDDALKLIRDDPLCSKPGTTFLYTTHGWTLISAVVEGATKKKIPTLLKDLFKDLGLEETYLDENDPIIYNRARYYTRNSKGRLVNTPYVDCSYKWAGGGLLSTAPDLVKFGNAMLYSYQHRPCSNDTACCDENTTKGNELPGYLKPETVCTLWSPVDKTKCAWDPDGAYGMGWAVTPWKSLYGQCREQRYYVSHTGGAIGASSVLLILPRKNPQCLSNSNIPQGVVVSMIINLQSVGLSKAALKIAKLFEEL